jgi:phage baseplate assembly protein gpV
MYEASGSCPGIPELRAGRHVDVRGVGRRFSGTYRLTKVVHALDGGGYRTDFGVTQRAGSSLLGLVRSSVADRPPPDDQPRVPGAVVGTVRSVDAATATVAVDVPSLSGDNMHVHATYMAPMAGRDRGMYFLPDAGDQVLVAFDEGSTRHAFVIGSVWAANQEPVSIDDRNRPIQRIRTASGHTVTFDDTSGSEQLVISHPIGSSVVLEADGSVVVTAKKDLDLRAPDGEIRLDARDVNVTVDNLMDVSGR